MWGGDGRAAHRTGWCSQLWEEKKRSVSHKRREKGTGWHRLEEWSILGTYPGVSSEPTPKPWWEAALTTITLLHNPRVLPDLTSQLMCQTWLQMTLSCSKNQTPIKGMKIYQPLSM